METQIRKRDPAVATTVAYEFYSAAVPFHGASERCKSMAARSGSSSGNLSQSLANNDNAVSVRHALDPAGRRASVSSPQTSALSGCWLL